MHIRIAYSIPAQSGWVLTRKRTANGDACELPVVAWGFADQTRVCIPLVAGEQPDLTDGSGWRLSHMALPPGHVASHSIDDLLTPWQ